MQNTIERQIVANLLDRLKKPPALIQVIVGPRQVGKTTAVKSLASRWDGPVHYAAADLPLPPGPEWIENQWAQAIRMSRDQPGRPGLLVLDEVQKVAGFGETIKRLWDEQQSLPDRSLSVILLGSSSLLLSRGTAESLAGRFFLYRCLHWSFDECRRAFGWTLDRWLYFGGYPGAAALIGEQDAWRAYIVDSLIEAVLARDVLAMQTVAKPALLRHLFVLAAQFPAQILSYTKMLGQLTDAGNTTTLAHYLRLLESAFLISGLERFSAGHARSKGSSPKLVLHNNALVSALSLRRFEELREDPSAWGRLVENAAGAHLINGLQGLPYEVTYWRQRNDEVDYVVSSGGAVWAVEIKSGRPGRSAGLRAFLRNHPRARSLVVGSGGVPLEEFFSTDPRSLLRP